MKNLLKISMLTFVLITFMACTSDDDSSILTASVNSTSLSAGDFGGDVIGNGGSATETFTWNNTLPTADYNMDITSSAGGTFRFMMKDAEGITVLDKTLDGGIEPDSYSGVTSAGTPGDWTVTLTLTNFNGDGSYSASSGD